MFKFLTRYSTYTLVVALLISAISAYYSIVGLTAIFAAAVIPIIVMGAALELGKLVAAVWLKLNWSRAPLTYKLYLVPAVAFLMALTSMGIFGFLSKAHSDQSLVSGDSMAKVAIYDEKIKIAKDNIEANRKALKQMDEAVDQMMGRSTDEKGADKAVAIRRGQGKERARLLQEIQAEQTAISKLNEEAAPLRAEFRKVEAEVGPIKYIAALIYGDNADANVLEKAVRFVIIMIVAVFDPLALVLILAAQQSMRWEKEDEEREEEEGMKDVEDFFKGARETAQQLDREAAEQAANELVDTVEADPSSEVSGDNKTDVEESILDKHPYLNQPFSHFKDTTPMVYKASDEVSWPTVEVATKPLEGEEALQVLKDTGIVTPEGKLANEYGGDETADSDKKILTFGVDVVDRPGDYLTTEGITTEVFNVKEGDQYVEFEGKKTSIDALRGMGTPVVVNQDNKILWGSEFPRQAISGDIHVRVDNLPHRVFKFNGNKWIELDRVTNTSYLLNDSYVQFLIEQLANGRVDTADLTEAEEEAIKDFLEKTEK